MIGVHEKSTFSYKLDQELPFCLHLMFVGTFTMSDLHVNQVRKMRISIA